MYLQDESGFLQIPFALKPCVWSSDCFLGLSLLLLCRPRGAPAPVFMSCELRYCDHLVPPLTDSLYDVMQILSAPTRDEGAVGYMLRNGGLNSAHAATRHMRRDY